MKSCIAHGSPCFTPVEIERRAKSKFLKQMIPLEVLCKFFTSLLNAGFRFIRLSTQNKYLRESDGKADTNKSKKSTITNISSNVIGDPVKFDERFSYETFIEPRATQDVCTWHYTGPHIIAVAIPPFFLVAI